MITKYLHDDTYKVLLVSTGKELTLTVEEIEELNTYNFNGEKLHNVTIIDDLSLDNSELREKINFLNKEISDYDVKIALIEYKLKLVNFKIKLIDSKETILKNGNLDLKDLKKLDSKIDVIDFHINNINSVNNTLNINNIIEELEK